MKGQLQHTTNSQQQAKPFKEDVNVEMIHLDTGFLVDADWIESFEGGDE